MSQNTLSPEAKKLYHAKLERVILNTYEALTTWKKYENDYNALKTTLEDLSQETEYRTMVPIGKLAFMPGKLVHTNEILAMLGDNWFAERSTKQAIGIVDRRLEMVRKTINDLEIQLENQKTKIGLTSDVLRFTNMEKEVNEEGLPIVEIQEIEENELQSRITKEKNNLKHSQEQIGQSQAKPDDTSFLDKFLAEEEEELRRGEASESNEESEPENDDDDDDYEEEWEEEEEVEQNDDIDSDEYLEDEESEEYKVKQIEQTKSPVDKAKQIEQKNAPVKSTVVENEMLPEECDAEVLEDEIWKKEIASEYHQKRIKFITQQGGLSSDESQLPHPIERPKKVSRFKAARLQGKLDDT
ncbi:11686_t:CDS:2 [Gigaspora margarita]|uniref:11686_t:CDS:1 n=1 Tax=Gigaspora margarita TaxID=4874 RepID=A0ABN7W506_GIGMA|nr:11686_t:CDS:2 [Gigaspora margarita]